MGELDGRTPLIVIGVAIAIVSVATWGVWAARSHPDRGLITALLVALALANVVGVLVVLYAPA